MTGEDHKTAIAVLKTKLEAAVEETGKSEVRQGKLIDAQNKVIEKLEQKATWNMRAALGTAIGLVVDFVRGSGNA